MKKGCLILDVLVNLRQLAIASDSSIFSNLSVVCFVSNDHDACGAPNTIKSVKIKIRKRVLQVVLKIRKRVFQVVLLFIY